MGGHGMLKLSIVEDVRIMVFFFTVVGCGVISRD